MTVLNLLPIPLPALEIAELTNTKTKIGAIALRAVTNNSPGRPIMLTPGTVTPNIAPIIKPMTIFKIKLDFVHFFIMFLTVSPLIVTKSFQNFICSLLNNTGCFIEFILFIITHMNRYNHGNTLFGQNNGDP